MNAAHPRPGAPAAPLAGVRLLELGGQGPGPFGSMMLAELGADVVRVDRPDRASFPGDPRLDGLNRGKRSVAADLKSDEGRDLVRRLAHAADVVIDPFRPGVSTRLGLGPDELLRENPLLIYVHMTGWGQRGPLAQAAGHDINYLALSGALHAIGPADGPPSVPLNLVGDFGGGGAYLVVGVLAALRQRDVTGRGGVVDVAIVDGVAHLMTGTYALMNAGVWTDERAVNLLDGGAPFYGVYGTADGRYVAVGAIESKFFAALVSTLGIAVDPVDQNDRATWPHLRSALTEAFARRTRDEWERVFAQVDACVTPVLSLREAAAHPHYVARRTVVRHEQTITSLPAPRISTYVSPSPTPPPVPGQDQTGVVLDWLGED